ncbi:winged helix-turn-helix domain-containing protein [Streptomyces sp. NBC_01262]|uniref:winged helix-turn-helix domain-containing protein n=1 Tax=Streptomyces sp. NBC_01262 TaxID=2903803 RepID=UPI002E374772|nr:response regulator transcription factor [Streptomyces sp. NBC_01262]
METTSPSSPRRAAGSGDYLRVHPRTVGQLRLLTVGPVELDLDGKQLRVAGAVIHLALKEFELLATLMDNAGRVMSRRELLDEVWEPGYPDHNKTLNVHIKRLRGHLEAADPSLPQRLRTVRGLGYVFDIDTDPSG